MDFGEFDAHFGGDGGLESAAFGDIFVVVGYGAGGFDEDVVGGVTVFEDEALGCLGHGKVGANWFRVDNILLVGRISAWTW